MRVTFTAESAEGAEKEFPGLDIGTPWVGSQAWSSDCMESLVSSTKMRVLVANTGQDLAIAIAANGPKPSEHGFHGQRMVEEEVDRVLVCMVADRGLGTSQPTHQGIYIRPLKRRLSDHRRWFFWRGFEEGLKHLDLIIPQMQKRGRGRGHSDCGSPISSKTRFPLRSRRSPRLVIVLQANNAAKAMELSLVLALSPRLLRTQGTRAPVTTAAISAPPSLVPAL